MDCTKEHEMDQVVTQLTVHNVRWRPRFRISTLLWLMALLSAFFCGRRSDNIGSLTNRWWQVTRVWLGADINPKQTVVVWPIGSATINENLAIHQVQVNDPKICSATLSSSRQLRVAPQSDGKTIVKYVIGNSPKLHSFEVVVEDGRIANWGLRR
jgi:hypothetical protein